MGGVLCYLLIPVATFALEIFCNVISSGGSVSEKVYLLYDLNSPLMLFSALALFVFFMDKNSFYNTAINQIASSTFAVYLLHDNSIFKEFMWRNIFLTKNTWQSSILVVILHAILCAIVLFAVAFVIEFLRKKLEDLIFKCTISDKLCKYVDFNYKI